MEIRQETSIKQIQTLSPQFILSQQLLQMPVTELRDELLKELSENPALELEEIATCPHCGRPIKGNRCENCGKRNELEENKTDDFIDQQIVEHDLDQTPYEGPVYNNEETTQFTHFTSSVGSFQDYLMHNFLASEYPPGMEDLGEFLVRSINEDGFLVYEHERVKSLFEATDEQVEAVIKVIQALDPPGVGARSAPEALLIQLRSLEEEGKTDELAYTIIENFFTELGKNRLQKIADALEVSISEIEKSLDFIRRNLNPYPGRAYTSREPVQLAKPAIVIKSDGKQLAYEVLELADFRLKINRSYLDMYQRYQGGDSSISRKDMSHIREYFRRAKFFKDSLQIRRNTLEKIAAALCEEQEDFLVHGLPNFNTDVTQGSLANKIELHESTVSRAMSGKFVQVPTGEILSFDFFFDSSIRPKEYIKNIIAREDPAKPASDKLICEILGGKGIKLARRTVAKYREELRIPSSYDRRRI